MTVPVYSGNPESTGPTVFDLDGDGIPEVLIKSGGYLTVLNGKDGSILFQDAFGGTLFSSQNVLVADVDGDGQVELVVIGHDRINSLEAMRVYQFGSIPLIPGQWPPHLERGSLPRHERERRRLDPAARSAELAPEQYLTTQAAIGPNPNPYLTPNLTASMLRLTQDSTGINLIIRVGNGGAKEALAGAPVTFYDGIPATGTVLGTVLTTRILQPGEYQDLILSVSSLADGLHHIAAVVDAGNTISECNKTDNQAQLDVTIATGLPDLKVGTRI